MSSEFVSTMERINFVYLTLLNTNGVVNRKSVLVVVKRDTILPDFNGRAVIGLEQLCKDIASGTLKGNDDFVIVAYRKDHDTFYSEGFSKGKREFQIYMDKNDMLVKAPPQTTFLVPNVFYENVDNAFLCLRCHPASKTFTQIELDSRVGITTDILVEKVNIIKN